MMVGRTTQGIAGPASVAGHARDPRQAPLVAIFAGANALVIGGVMIGLGIAPVVHPGQSLYVVTLGLLCTLPLLFLRSIRGRGALLLVYQAFFFAQFGLADWAAMLGGTAIHRPPDAFLTGGEVAILLTSLCFTAGYGAVLQSMPPAPRGWFSRDWAPQAVGVMGIVFWVIGFFLFAMFMSGVDLNRATSTGFAMFGSFGGVFVLLSYLLPVGDICFIYLFLHRRSRLALAVLLVMIACEFALGLLSSSKELGFRAMLLFIFSVPFLRGRLPIGGVIAYILLAGLTFSFFQDMRNYVARHGMDFSQGLERLTDKSEKVFGKDTGLASRFQRGLEYFASRGNLKGNIELIVARTGKDVAFQEGYTVGLLRYAFIPRFILPDKPMSTVGLLFNHEFGVSDVKTVFISTGQNGELYWNWGWPGLLLGMTVIGALMAALNCMVDLDRRVTLPRFLFLMLTLYLLAFRFEASIAQQYTLWARAIVMLALIHLCMPKAREAGVGAAPAAAARPRAPVVAQGRPPVSTAAGRVRSEEER